MTFTRRKFIKAGFLLAGGLAVADAFWAEKFFIEVKELFHNNSSKENYRLKIIQISDLHITSLNSQLKTLAKKINRLNPDLICLTGDAVDKQNNLVLLDEFLRLINFEIKKVAILGNWEYWGNIDLQKLDEIYKLHNCDLLINECRQYIFKNSKLSIIGIDDLLGGNADVNKAIKGYQPSDFNLILNHCPAYSDVIGVELEKKLKFDFILSGHTHGGQINFFGYVPFLPQGSGKYLKGWYKDDFKKMYVSKGIGTSILPARFGARAEIGVFYL